MESKNVKNGESRCVHGKDPIFKNWKLTFCGRAHKNLPSPSDTDRAITCKTCKRVMKTRGIK